MFSRIKHKVLRYLSALKVLGFKEATLFEWNWTRRRPVVPVNLPGYRNPLYLRRHESDLNVFSQVFYEKELESFLPVNPELIIDAGANVGYTAAFYAQRFPNALVIAIEPDAKNFEMLQRNCSGFPNIRCLHAAVWHREAMARVSNPNAESWSFQVEESVEPEAARIPARTIDGILAESGYGRIDLLKLDIEGAERQLFSENLDRWLPRVDAIALEIHGEDADRAVMSAMPAHQFEHGAAGERRFFRRLRSDAENGSRD